MSGQIVEVPLFLARFDLSLHCQSLSRCWYQILASSEKSNLLEPHSSLVRATDLLCLVDGGDLEVQLQLLLSEGDQLSGVRCLLCGHESQGQFQLNAWRETVSETKLLSVLLLPTEHNDTEKDDELLKKSYELILGAAGEGIYGVDAQGLATFANKASTRILGWEANEILGTPAHDIHHHTHADGRPYPKEDCPIYAALKDGEVHRVDNEVFWRNDGTSVPVEYISTPIVNQGIIEGAVIVFRDISERKSYERQREKDFQEIKHLKEELELERDYLRDEIKVIANFAEIIGESKSLKHALSQVEAVASTSSSVLVLGESGVGKEMIARAIHNKSQRCDAPLVKVNCASIPKELFESEFFGHVKGSFTGAHRDRVGRLQLANKGTLFLDEVGEIPLDLQSKLLRALQEQEFERVGDENTVRVDVRIIAATNKDLLEEVKAGRFREDLYYRLSVFPISVPPLRERLKDITLLAQHFLTISCQELGREPMRLTATQGNILSRHDWPGNVRELKNVVERAVILSRGQKLRLDLAMPDNPYAVEEIARENHSADDEFLTDAQCREFEKNNLIKVLNLTNWKISGSDGAANLLGLKPSTLTYRMQQFGIKK